MDKTKITEFSSIEDLRRNALPSIPSNKGKRKAYRAETDVKYILEKLGCEVIANKLIWTSSSFMTTEMDFIVYYKKNLFIVEVKNWYGNVIESDYKTWTVTSNYRGKVHKSRRTSPVYTVGRFRTDLGYFLINNGFDVTKDVMDSLVVFTRDEFDFSFYSKDHSHTTLLKKSDLEHFLINTSEGTTDRKLFEQMRQLPDWDKIILNDNTYVTGKILINKIQLLGEEKITINCSDIDYVKFDFVESLAEVVTNDGVKHIGEVDIESVEFHLPKNIEKEGVKLVFLDRNLHSAEKLSDFIK